MACNHPVYDTDKHFVIDSITKKISNKSSKIVIPQHTHKAERFTFEIARTVEGHDMSLSNVVEIHFQNISAADRNIKSVGVQKADSLEVVGDNVVFSWLIEGDATKYDGILMFAIHFSCVENGVVQYNLSTLSYSTIRIGATVWNSEYIALEYSDVIAEFENRISALEKGSPNSDWNAAEDEPGYVKNRTHYTENKLIWLTENTTVKLTATAPVAKPDWIDYATMQGCNLARVIFDGVTYDCPVVWYKDPYMDGDSSCQIGNYLGSNPEIPFGILAFKGSDGHGTVSFRATVGTHTVSFAKMEEVVHKLDKKYIPDDVGGVSSWNDLTDKPFGESDNAVLLPPTQFAYDSAFGLFAAPGYIDFMVGKTYTVNWNGVDYETEAFPGQFNGADLVVLGNPAALGGANNNLPFAVACLMDSIGAIPLDGSTAVNVGITGFGVVPLPSRYNNAYHLKRTVERTTDASTWHRAEGFVATAERVLQSGGELFYNLTEIFPEEGNRKIHHIMRLVSYGKDLRGMGIDELLTSSSYDPEVDHNCLVFGSTHSVIEDHQVFFPQADGMYR